MKSIAQSTIAAVANTTDALKLFAYEPGEVPNEIRERQDRILACLVNQYLSSAQIETANLLDYLSAKSIEIPEKTLAILEIVLIATDELPA